MSAETTERIHAETSHAANGEVAAGLGGLARSTYDELRAGGFTDTDIMAFAGELLSLLASGVRDSSNP